VILCPQGHPNPNGTTYCAECKQYIDTTTAPVEPPTEVLPPEPLVSLSQPLLSARVGSEATCEVLIEGDVAVAKRYSIEISGDAAAFASVDPSSVDVAPRTVAVVQLTFRPVAPAAAGGELSYVVTVAPSDRPEVPRLVMGRIELTPAVAAASLQLRPQTSRGRGGAQHLLIVQNLGPEPMTAKPRADPLDSAAIAFQPPTVAVPAGGTATVQVRIRPHEELWFGKNEHPFRVSVGDQAEAAGVMIQRPRVPVGLALAVALLAVAAVVFVSSLGSDDGVDGEVHAIPHLNVRAGPGVGFDDVGEIPDGDEIVIECRTRTNWLRLIEPSEHEGAFVAGNKVEVAERVPLC
jgi:hypothetical protein